MKKISSVLAALLLSSILVSVNGAPASALDSASQPGSLLELASTDLGVEITDEQLADELESDLEYAIEEEIIDETVIDALEGAENQAELESEVGESLSEIGDSQDLAWENESEFYRAAFEAVRAEFQTCRATAGPANICAAGLGFKMQIAIATDSLSEIKAIEDSMVGLDPNSQEYLDLQAAKEQLLAKIDRAQQKLDSLPAKGETGKAKKHLEEISTEADSLSNGHGNSGSKGQGSSNSGSKKGDDSADAGSSSGNGQSGGNGNSGNSGKGNGKGNGKD